MRPRISPFWIDIELSVLHKSIKDKRKCLIEILKTFMMSFKES